MDSIEKEVNSYWETLLQISHMRGLDQVCQAPWIAQTDRGAVFGWFRQGDLEPTFEDERRGRGKIIYDEE